MHTFNRPKIPERSVNTVPLCHTKYFMFNVASLTLCFYILYEFHVNSECPVRNLAIPPLSKIVKYPPNTDLFDEVIY